MDNAITSALLFTWIGFAVAHQISAQANSDRLNPLPRSGRYVFGRLLFGVVGILGMLGVAGLYGRVSWLHGWTAPVFGALGICIFLVAHRFMKAHERSANAA